MCGLAGIYSNEFSESWRTNAIESIVARMTASLIHRGPDSGGQFVSFPVALGHRRLSILELSAAGAQPMRFGEYGPILTYNGEVYNFQELRRELLSLGCEFRGHSDTEVVLHSYVKWGLPGLKRLEGIFALALWDPAEQRLVLMRDRFGVKPLFYGESNVGLAFGSEIKSVLAAGGINTCIEDQTLAEYLWYGNPHGNRTFYKGVRSLEPGQWLIVEGGKKRVECWWRVEEWLDRPLTSRTLEEAAEEVRHAVDIAVSRQLVADVPVGIFLSGGVDSSTVAAAAAAQNFSLNSYSASFDFDGGVNELAKAARVASHLGLSHHELRISGADLPDVLRRLSKAHDEPFGDAANIPLYLMCKQLQGNVRVVLQGDGGDEVFAGYRRYAVLRNAHWWRLWPDALTPLARAGGAIGHRFVRMANAAGNSDPALRMAYLLTQETTFFRPEGLLLESRQRELAESTDPFLAYRIAADRFRHRDAVDQMLLTDLTVQLPCQFLTKVDRSTMAAGVEARVPLLDEKIAQLAVNMPSLWKAKGAQKKIVLRKSQSSRLPADILNGPKTGFGVPYEHWLRSSLYEFSQERLLDNGFAKSFGIDRIAVERALEEHRNKSVDRGYILWKLLQLALFYEARIDIQPDTVSQ